MANQKLWAELLLLFVLMPIGVFWWVSDLHLYLMPILFGVGMACLAVLLADNQFKRFRLWHIRDFRSHCFSALRVFLPWACLLTVAIYVFLPEAFLSWPREQTGLWVMTLLIYPIVSVIPQEIIFRTYFFHRYKRILPSKHHRWALSTFLFGVAHIVYGNWLAVVCTWFGGALFGYRYMQTRSTAIVVIEHTLWGSFVFTIGLGAYLVVQV